MLMIKYCLSVTVLLLGLAAARGAEPAHLVFMIGEDEYRTAETLPEFAQKDLQPLGYRVTIINADAANPNDFPGLVPALSHADLLFLSVRRRTPLKEQLEAVRTFLAAGKPLVGIRTACHAFALRPKDKLSDPKLALWQEFDPEVIGGHYTGHHGKTQLPAVAVVPGAEKHPIVSGISFEGYVSGGSLYQVNPLEKGTTPLLLGTIAGQPAEPVAWTHLYGSRQGRVFYTSLGHVDDFKKPEFRRLLVQGIAWALGGAPNGH
jgi:type 1 glutamine amidotransferase